MSTIACHTGEFLFPGFHGTCSNSAMYFISKGIVSKETDGKQNHKSPQTSTHSISLSGKNLNHIILTLNRAKLENEIGFYHYTFKNP